MRANVGGADRLVRIIAGLILLSLVWLVPTNWGWLGIVPLMTGLIRWCPAYLPFGLNSCKR
ncbi:YgaP family membrane protein [Undibacterium squillarum]|uniref:YgaP family membrane protein n=1 Tax=Undibacterium squillarum TaxID=1131567 RepID=UPI0035B3A5BF